MTTRDEIRDLGATWIDAELAADVDTLRSSTRGGRARRGRNLMNPSTARWR